MVRQSFSLGKEKMKKFLTLLLFVFVLSDKSVFSAEIFFDCTCIGETVLTATRNFEFEPKYNEGVSRVMFFLDTNTMTATYGNSEIKMKAVRSKNWKISIFIPPSVLDENNIIGINFIIVPIPGYQNKFLEEQLIFATENGSIKNSIIRGICTSQLK